MTAARFSPAVRRDLLAAMKWIAKDNPAAARALQSNVAKVAVTIGEHPYADSLRPEVVAAPFRCISPIGFPYVIVYHADHRPPVIARIFWRTGTDKDVDGAPSRTMTRRDAIAALPK